MDFLGEEVLMAEEHKCSTCQEVTGANAGARTGSVICPTCGYPLSDNKLAGAVGDTARES